MSLKSIMFLGLLTTTLFAQSKSAVQFYDTTGATKTGKIGWTGDAATGQMFIQTTQDGVVLSTQSGGNVTVKGTVSAAKFSGDGSSLTNLPASAAPTISGVTGLQDSLNAKATASSVSSLQSQLGAKADSSSINTKLNNKANASDVTALQTLVGAKADTTMLKKKADTSWVLTKIGAAGGGTITGVTADSGLSGGGASGTVDLKVKYGGNGSAATVARSDHTHTGLTDANISSLSYSKISGVPTIPTSLPPSGVAGGALGGTYPNPGIAAGAVTDANISSVGFGKVTGLSDSLKKKADTGWVKSQITSSGVPANSVDSTKIVAGGISGTNINSGAKLNVGAIMASSNVSIGTTSVGSPLSVQATSGGSGIRIVGRSTSINQGLLEFFQNDNSTLQGQIAGSSGLLSLRDVNGTNVLNVTNGSVGIGTTNPDRKLQVMTAGTSGSDAPGAIEADYTGTTNGDAALEAYHTGAQPGTGYAGYMTKTGAGGTNVALYLSASGATNNYGLIINAGNVGVGTTTPQYALDVNGTIRGANVSAASDRRFKTDITPIDSSLSKISKLQGVYYNWDRKKWPQKNFPNGKQVGLIAQEVEMVVPEVVNTDKEGYKSLSYDKLTAVLIEAVKEQQKEIEGQKEMIVSLKKEVEGLKAGTKK